MNVTQNATQNSQMLPNVIGALLRKWRMEADLSQEELAAKINCHKRTIIRWESGQTAPTVTEIVKITKALNYNWDEAAKQIGKAIA